MQSRFRLSGCLILICIYLGLALNAVAHDHDGVFSGWRADATVAADDAGNSQLPDPFRTGHFCAMCAATMHAGPPASFVIVPPSTPVSLSLSSIFVTFLAPDLTSAISRRGPPVLAA